MLSLYKFFASKGQMVGFLLGILLVGIILLIVFLGISNGGYEVGDDFNKMMKMEDSTHTFDFFEWAAKIPVYLALLIVAIMIVFGVVQIVTNPKGSMKILAGFGIVLLLTFIFYTMSEPETTGKIGELHDKFGVSDTASRLISGGLKSVLTLAGGAIVLMIVSEIRNLFK